MFHIALLPLFITAFTGQQQPPAVILRFVHITDTHLTAASSAAPLQRLAAEVGAMHPAPEFVIDTGDVTEAGNPAEFELFKRASAAITVPVYVCPGNHDVRWSPTGKQEFARQFKALYQSFDAGGCHFVLLDSSLVLEHWGHFDNQELLWLSRDLKRIKRTTPLFLFFHHWLGRGGPVIDNREALLQITAPYNVVAMFVGHGHADLVWKTNGISCFMARGLYQGSYHRIDVGPADVRVYRVRTGEEAALIATVPLQRGARYTAAVEWDDPDVAILARRQLIASLVDTDRRRPVPSASATYQVDNRAPGPMEADTRQPPDGRTPPEGRYVARFNTADLDEGSHTLRVQITSADGDTYHRDKVFSVVHSAGGTAERWSADMGSGIQNSAAVAEGRVYCGTRDGHVACFRAMDGRRLWSTLVGGQLLGAPLAAGSTIYVASTSGILYALDAPSGHISWHYDTGGQLYSTPAVSGNTVCTGGAGSIYGLDAATGVHKWTVPSGAFYQSRALAADGAFILGGWDNNLICLEAETGGVRWKVPMGRSRNGALLFYFSPAIASPCADNGRIFVCTDDGLLHCVNLKTGAPVWLVHAPAKADVFGYSSPVAANGVVYVGGLGEAGRGDCYAVEEATGKILWDCQTHADNYDSGAALQGSHVVIGSVNGRLSWIDSRTGKLKYQYCVGPGYCFATPCTDSQDVFIGSLGRRLYDVHLYAAKAHSRP